MYFKFGLLNDPQATMLCYVTSLIQYVTKTAAKERAVDALTVFYTF